MRNKTWQVSRRDALKFGSSAAVAALAWPTFSAGVRAEHALTLADIGVGDPGDWSRFTEGSGTV